MYSPPTCNRFYVLAGLYRVCKGKLQGGRLLQRGDTTKPSQDSIKVLDGAGTIADSQFHLWSCKDMGYMGYRSRGEHLSSCCMAPGPHHWALARVRSSNRLGAEECIGSYRQQLSLCTPGQASALATAWWCHTAARRAASMQHLGCCLLDPVQQV
jgi:hypothetical protein